MRHYSAPHVLPTPLAPSRLSWGGQGGGRLLQFPSPGPAQSPQRNFVDVGPKSGGIDQKLHGRVGDGRLESGTPRDLGQRGGRGRAKWEGGAPNVGPASAPAQTRILVRIGATGAF